MLLFPTGLISLSVLTLLPTSSGNALGERFAIVRKAGEIFQTFGGGGAGLATGNLAGCLTVLVPRVNSGSTLGRDHLPVLRFLALGFLRLASRIIGQLLLHHSLKFFISHAPKLFTLMVVDFRNFLANIFGQVSINSNGEPLAFYHHI